MGINGTQRSYIDYFVTNNINHEEVQFEITDPIANSDHRLLKLKIPYSQFGKIKIGRETRSSFNIHEKETENIKKNILNILKGCEKIKEDLCEMITKLRIKNKPRMRKKYSGIR